MNKSDLEALVNVRIKEAKLLLDNKCYEGAYYLLGYALECAIKVCIAKQVKEHDFPDKNLANASSRTKDLFEAITNNKSGILVWIKSWW